MAKFRFWVLAAAASLGACSDDGSGLDLLHGHHHGGGDDDGEHALDAAALDAARC